MAQMLAGVKSFFALRFRYALVVLHVNRITILRIQFLLIKTKSKRLFSRKNPVCCFPGTEAADTPASLPEQLLHLLLCPYSCYTCFSVRASATTACQSSCYTCLSEQLLHLLLCQSSCYTCFSVRAAATLCQSSCYTCFSVRAAATPASLSEQLLHLLLCQSSCYTCFSVRAAIDNCLRRAEESLLPRALRLL